MQKFSFFGIFLVVVGAFLLLRNILDLDIPFWDFVFPLLLILWGASMLINNITHASKKKNNAPSIS